MATLTLGGLDDELVARLHQRAAAAGRSPKAEHRAILQAALAPTDAERSQRREAAARLAEFRERTAGRGSAPAAELLRESQRARLRTLTGGDGEGLL